MRKYIDIRNDYEYSNAIKEIEKIESLKHLIAPLKVEDDGRTIVNVNLRGANDVNINVEGRYDLIQKLLDQIHASRK
jgi:hypothetical protein